MKLAVVGSRRFGNYDLYFFDNNRDSAIAKKLTEIDYQYLCFKLKGLNITEIISGGAKGADSLAERYANENNIFMTVFIPEWSLYGKSAGYRRNELIVENSDEVYAFWDGESPGTKHSIELAKKLNKPITVFTDWRVTDAS